MTPEQIQQATQVAVLIRDSGLDEREVARRVDAALRGGADPADPVALVRGALQNGGEHFKQPHDESKHPRDAQGKWTSGPGGGGGADDDKPDTSPSSVKSGGQPGGGSGQPGDQSEPESLELTLAGQYKPGVWETAKKWFGAWMKTQITAKAAQQAMEGVTGSQAIGYTAFTLAAIGDNLVPMVPAGAAVVLTVSAGLELAMRGSLVKTGAGIRDAIAQAGKMIRGGVVGAAKALGIARDEQKGQTHPTVTRATNSEKARRMELEALTKKGIDPQQAMHMYDAAESFTVASGKIKAAQRGDLTGVSAASAAKIQQQAQHLEDWIGARGPFDPEQPISRGMVVPADVAAQFKTGVRIDGQGSTSSWTTDPRVAGGFSKPEVGSGNVGVTFELIGGASKSASVVGISAHPQESEVLVGKDVAMQVTDVVKQPDGSLRVMLREG